MQSDGNLENRRGQDGVSNWRPSLGEGLSAITTRPRTVLNGARDGDGRLGTETPRVRHSVRRLLACSYHGPFHEDSLENEESHAWLPARLGGASSGCVPPRGAVQIHRRELPLGTRPCLAPARYLQSPVDGDDERDVVGGQPHRSQHDDHRHQPGLGDPGRPYACCCRCYAAKRRWRLRNFWLLFVLGGGGGGCGFFRMFFCFGLGFFTKRKASAFAWQSYSCMEGLGRIWLPPPSCSLPLSRSPAWRVLAEGAPGLRSHRSPLPSGVAAPA